MKDVVIHQVSTRQLKKELYRRVVLAECSTESLEAEVERRKNKEKIYQRQSGEADKKAERQLFVKFVSEKMRVHPDVMISRDRHEPLATDRLVAMTALRRSGVSLQEVGDLFGGRDHSTVQKADRAVWAKPELQSRVIDLMHEWNQYRR